MTVLCDATEAELLLYKQAVPSRVPHQSHYCLGKGTLVWALPLLITWYRLPQSEVEAEMEAMDKDPKIYKTLPTIFDFYTEVCCLLRSLVTSILMFDSTRQDVSSCADTTRTLHLSAAASVAGAYIVLPAHSIKSECRCR